MAMAGLFLISNYSPTSLALSPSLSLSTHHPQHPKPASFKPISPAVRFPVPGDGDPRRWRSRARGVTVVTRAGPTTNSYVLAFLLPLSLIVITVFTALRIGDKLDQDYLEEVALNEAIRKAEEEEEQEDDDDDEDEVEDEDADADVIDLPSEQPVTPRTRNRPIREI